MKFKGHVFVVSTTNPDAEPIMLQNADVEMAYDYEDHLPGKPLIVLRLTITPDEGEHSGRNGAPDGLA